MWAQTEDGVRGFLVETDRPGFEARDIKGKLSLRASITSELFLSDVEVPEESRLPKAEGMKGPLSLPHPGALRHRLGRARRGDGLLRGGRRLQPASAWCRAARSRASSSPRRSSPTCSPRSPRRQLLALRVGRLKDAGRLHHTMVSMAKRNNVDVALQIARACRDLLGANGIVDDYQAMRHMVNLETVRTYEGTHDVHTLILGEHITGLRAL